MVRFISNYKLFGDDLLKNTDHPEHSFFAVNLIIRVIRGYQITLSGFFPGCCRFEPTCSQYAIDMIQQQGVCKGGLLAWLRLCKCHPFYPTSRHRCGLKTPIKNKDK